jgi:hypothetical protein
MKHNGKSRQNDLLFARSSALFESDTDASPSTVVAWIELDSDPIATE